jgi:hypothetical protein
VAVSHVDGLSEDVDLHLTAKAGPAMLFSHADLPVRRFVTSKATQANRRID